MDIFPDVDRKRDILGPRIFLPVHLYLTLSTLAADVRASNTLSVGCRGSKP